MLLQLNTLQICKWMHNLTKEVHTLSTISSLHMILTMMNTTDRRLMANTTSNHSLSTTKKAVIHQGVTTKISTTTSMATVLNTTAKKIVDTTITSREAMTTIMAKKLIIGEHITARERCTRPSLSQVKRRVAATEESSMRRLTLIMKSPKENTRRLTLLKISEIVINEVVKAVTKKIGVEMAVISSPNITKKSETIKDQDKLARMRAISVRELSFIKSIRLQKTLQMIDKLMSLVVKTETEIVKAATNATMIIEAIKDKQIKETKIRERTDARADAVAKMVRETNKKGHLESLSRRLMFQMKIKTRITLVSMTI